MRFFGLVALVGCSFTHGALSGSGDAATSDGSGRAIDASIDAMIDAPSGNCYGPSGAFEICLAQPPSQSLSYSSISDMIDTGDPGCANAGGVVRGQIGGPQLCVVAGTQISISGTLVGVGTRPLVLVASDSLSVNGIIDVSSDHFGQSGAGSNDPACVAGTAGGDDSSGGGGGAGGSFGTHGGDGGTGDGGNGTAGLASAAIAAPPMVVHGGCGGRHGGNETGEGGRGGGAVYLLGETSLSVSGRVDASGAAGLGGGTSRHGGAGGGSGGMIALWSESVSVSGEMFANGGGAGEGADNNTPGADGFESTGAQSVGFGGSTSSSGGSGGDGAIGSANGGNGSNASNGGGGGGGGQGLIHVVSGQTIGGTVSPPAM